jgi:hypothetical protein
MDFSIAGATVPRVGIGVMVRRSQVLGHLNAKSQEILDSSFH